MSKLEKLKRINRLLLEDQPEYKEAADNIPGDYTSQRRLMRSLMNVRYPNDIPQELKKCQDEFLVEERDEKGVVHIGELPACDNDARLVLWQGDITRLDADAIVNAANEGYRKKIQYIQTEDARKPYNKRGFRLSPAA